MKRKIGLAIGSRRSIDLSSDPPNIKGCEELASISHLLLSCPRDSTIELKQLYETFSWDASRRTEAFRGNRRFMP